MGSYNTAVYVEQGGSKLVIESGGELEIQATGTIDFDAAINVGENDTGYDVTFYGATSGSYMLWDEDLNTLALAASGMTITSASGYAIDIQTTGQFRMGIQGTGIPTATATPYAMEIHAETNADAVIEAIGGGTGLTCGIRCRYEISKAQTAQISFTAIEGRLRPKAGLADGVHSAVSGTIEGDASIAYTGTSTTQRNAGNFCVELGASSTISAGWLTGVTIDSSTDDTVSMANCTYAGLRIKKSTGKEVWEHGIYINDSAATTGITIGTSTTGIEFTGTTTNCISIPASATGITKLIRVGTWGNDVVLAADDEFVELLCTVSSATHSKPLVRFRMEGGAANMTTGNIIALECLAYGNTTYTMHDMTAIVAHTGAKGTSALTSTAKMRAAYLKIEDLGNNLDLVSGSYACPLWMEMQFNSGSTFSGNMYWVNFSKYGSETSLYGDAVFRFEDQSGGGWATSFILMDNGRAPFSTGGASGATGSDAKLRCDIGGTHYTIALYAE